MSSKRTIKSGSRLPRELKKQTTTRKYGEDYPKTGSNAETEVSLRRSHSTMRATFIHTDNIFRRYYDITNDITGISQQRYQGSIQRSWRRLKITKTGIFKKNTCFRIEKKMAQALIDLMGSVRKCRYCDKTFKSEAGENNHMKRLHPLDMESDACCWTCNKPFTKRQLLYQHFSTVQHQINCKKLQEGEIPKIKTRRNTANRKKYWK